MNPTQPTATVPTPADQYATLKSAVLGAQVNTAPGASPLGNFPEIAKLYSSAPAVAKSDLASAGPQYNTGVRVASDAAAAAAARARAEAAAENDPSKYKQVLTQDGGYKFYDAQGNEISASLYAAARNESPADVLKNSYNPIDRAFIEDYKSLRTYYQDRLDAHNGDKAAQARAQATETQVKKLYGLDIQKKNPVELGKIFAEAYPTVYGLHTAGPQGLNTLFPSAASIKSSTKGSVSGGAL